MGEPTGPEAVAELGPGSVVDHFRVVRLLGAGGMGQVWLARDTRLGRKVALKVVTPGRLDARARARFREEAEATAGFSHPNIVTLYEVGELAGTPWVALEFIEGETLRERLARERLGPRQAIELGHAIASATAEAHRQGVLHLDLKPGNVLIGRDGRARVVDFGLARRVPAYPGHDDTTDRVAPVPDTLEPTGDSTVAARVGAATAARGEGTPRYMAPEQWRGEPPSPATDVWQLGIVLHELVHGRHPFGDLRREELRRAVTGDAPTPALPAEGPAAVIALIAACLAKAPHDRPRADQVAEVLGHALDRSAASGRDNPFRGLLAFTEREADAFFGRDAEISAFLERLRDEPVLPIVGPSGAGKSSFVQAGVVPRLREAGAWTVLTMRPGARPLQTLAALLLRGETSEGVTPPGAETATLTLEGEAGGPARPAPRVDGDAAAALATRLATSPEAASLALRARADAHAGKVLLFVDQLEELYTHVDDPATRRAFMRAVVGAADDRDDPVRVCFTLRDDFLGRVAEDDATRAALERVTVLRAPGAEVLREILELPAARAGLRWEAGVVDEIIAAVRGQAGGLPVVQFTARQVWHRRDQARGVLTRGAYDAIGGVAGALAAHADGVLAGLGPAELRAARAVCLRLVSAEGTRRVVARAELIDGLPPAAADVVDRLVVARLCTARRGHGDDPGGEIELAHESLLRGWDRLARWRDEARDELISLAQAAQAAALWAQRGRRDAELWQGDALAEARIQLARVDGPLPPPVATFLAACQRVARRARRRRRGLVAIALCGLAAIAIAATAVALRIRGEERAAQRRLAEAQREGARAALAADDPLQARARLRASLETEDSPLGRALWLSLARSPTVWRKRFAAAIYGVAFAPDDRTVAAVGQDGAAYLIDLATGATRTLHGGDQLFAVAFAPGGARLAAGAWNGTLSIWDLATGAVQRLPGHVGLITGVAWRGDDELVSSGADGTLRRWDPTTGAERARWTSGEELTGLAVEGAIAITTSPDDRVRRWQLEGGASTVIATIAATSVALDHGLVAIGGQDGTILLVPATGGAARALGTHAGRISTLALAGDRLVSADVGGAMHVWDRATGRELRALAGHTDDIAGLALSRDGARLVSASNDQTVRLWRLDGADAPGAEPGHRMPVVGVDIAGDGATLVSASYDQTVRTWDAATGAPRAILRGHHGRIWSVKFIPGSPLAISASNDATLRLWDVARGVAVAELRGHGAPVFDVAVTADGRTAASGSSDGTVRLWDLPAGAPRRTIDVGSRVDGVALSPDGRLVAAGTSSHLVAIFDAATGAPRQVLRGHRAAVPGVAFSPDATRVASCGEDGELRLWDLASGESRVLATGARLYRVAFAADGHHLAAAGADGVGRLYDLEGGAVIALRGHLGEINELRFAGDGRTAVSGGNDGTVRVWDTATGAPCWRARAVRLHDRELLRHTGWTRLGGAPFAPPPTRWRAALASATAGDETEDGAHGCVMRDGAVAWWDLAADRELARWPSAPDRIVAMPTGCAELAGGRARWRAGAGPDADRDLGDRVTAIARAGREMVLARADQIVAVDPHGRARVVAGVDPGASAVALIEGGAIVGYPDGNAVYVASDARVAMEGVEASPVVAAAGGGAAATVVLGFGSGVFGVWHAATGVRIHRGAVHGPARHLLADGDRVIAVSELGDQAALDVAPMRASYCDLLRAIWAEVPVVWTGDGPTVTPPPTGHACRR